MLAGFIASPRKGTLCSRRLTTGLGEQDHPFERRNLKRLFPEEPIEHRQRCTAIPQIALIDTGDFEENLLTKHRQFFSGR